MKIGNALLTVALLTSYSANAAVIEIQLSTFNNPSILDFETEIDRVVTTSDALFTAFGISSLAATGSALSADNYQDGGATSGRGIFTVAGDLVLISPSAAPGPAFVGNSEWTIDLSATQTRFGLAVLDATSNFTLTLFDSGLSVGSISFTHPTGQPFDPAITRYLESDVPFDRVVVSGLSDSYGLDNITIDAVPEPSAFSMLSGALLSIVLRRRRPQSLGEQDVTPNA